MAEDKKTEVESETYRKFIELEWRDIHHSRVQEWSALGVVTGVHLGIVHLLRLIHDLKPPLPIEFIAVCGCFFCIVFSVLGMLLTCRHQRLMKIKLSWIYQAEKKLHLVKTHDDPKGIIPENKKLDDDIEWNGLMWPRYLSTGWLMIHIYGFLIFLSISGIAMFSGTMLYNAACRFLT